jgi:hypothetical protein
MQLLMTCIHLLASPEHSGMKYLWNKESQIKYNYTNILLKLNLRLRVLYTPL